MADRLFIIISLITLLCDAQMQCPAPRPRLGLFITFDNGPGWFAADWERLTLAGLGLLGAYNIFG